MVHVSTINSLRKIKAQTSLPDTVQPRDLKKEAQSLALQSFLSDEPTDTIEIRQQPLSEKIVSKVRGPILTAAKVALPLVGAAIAGPVGLGIGIAARMGLSVHEARGLPTKTKVKDALINGAFAGAIGTLGFIPGTIGLAVTAATGLGLTALANKAQQGKTPPTIRLEKFADSYLPKVEKKLGDGQSFALTETKGLNKSQKGRLAAQAILNATQVCCEQLSPAIAVALARETAKELIPAGSLQEKILEATFVTQDSFELVDTIKDPSEKELADKDLNRIILTDIDADTPAAATTSHVLLEPRFLKENSPEGLAVAIGHEFSHIEHRDVIGNVGEMSLLTALEAAGDQSLSPKAWGQTEKIQNEVNLASAEISRETEYRCDREGADRALAQGATPEQVSEGFREIFGDHAGSDDPYAEHPLTKDRIAALDAHVKPKSPLKLRDFSDWMSDKKQ